MNVGNKLLYSSVSTLALNKIIVMIHLLFSVVLSLGCLLHFNVLIDLIIVQQFCNLIFSVLVIGRASSRVAPIIGSAIRYQLYRPCFLVSVSDR